MAFSAYHTLEGNYVLQRFLFIVSFSREHSSEATHATIMCDTNNEGPWLRSTESTTSIYIIRVLAAGQAKTGRKLGMGA